MNSKPFVLAHPADHYACGLYRVIWPLQALIYAGHCDGVVCDYLLDDETLAGLHPDIVIFQRVLELDQIAAIKRYRRILPNARFIFEIDDLLTNIPADNKFSGLFPHRTLDRLKQGMGLCDRLVVSTNPLLEAYGAFAPDASLSRNMLPDNVWDVPHVYVPHDKPRVGWAGSSGHLGDLKLLIPVVRATCDLVDWVFLGPVPEVFRKFAREVHATVPLSEYPAKLSSLDLDLAVAPLEVHPYNDAKSCLRILELGICAYPVLCSGGVGAFDVDLPVFRVANNADDWIDAITSLTFLSGALKTLGVSLANQIKAGWMLSGALDQWARAWLIMN